MHVRKSLSVFFTAGVLLAASHVQAFGASLPAAAWDAWTARGERIMAAVSSDESVRPACDGVVREMIRYPMPQWAQSMIHLCTALNQAQTGHLICTERDPTGCTRVETGLSPMQARKICQESRAALGALKGAKPVDGSPDAYPMALQLVRVGEALKVRYRCVL